MLILMKTTMALRQKMTKHQRMGLVALSTVKLKRTTGTLNLRRIFLEKTVRTKRMVPTALTKMWLGVIVTWMHQMTMNLMNLRVLWWRMRRFCMLVKMMVWTSWMRWQKWCHKRREVLTSLRRTV